MSKDQKSSAAGASVPVRSSSQRDPLTEGQRRKIANIRAVYSKKRQAAEAGRRGSAS
ncbi:hypothetical protein INN71_15130 [Nocardioides sp. ChNu-153]|uniref:hypothetical protein n=1 Tax=unclassified Nocardioides TaxID=2615069 RepID=UPI0024071359|nr:MULTISPECIES: hypothetical protein [unclassified Nocardioides]MDF9716316.1 hypothetical protein [Nocardioides sp. ChNu-99]MDN7122722.1 hypothetical protein [Nocardioides sp. ChNu-153]